MDLWLTRELAGWLVARLCPRCQPCPGMSPRISPELGLPPCLWEKREGSDPVPSPRRCPPSAHQGAGSSAAIREASFKFND